MLNGAVLAKCHRGIAHSDGNARNIRQFFAAIGSHAEVWLRSLPAAVARKISPGGKNRDSRASNLYQLCIAIMSPL
jgi:hypothetical protein